MAPTDQYFIIWVHLPWFWAIFSTTKNWFFPLFRTKLYTTLIYESLQEFCTQNEKKKWFFLLLKNRVKNFSRLQKHLIPKPRTLFRTQALWRRVWFTRRILLRFRYSELQIILIFVFFTRVRFFPWCYQGMRLHFKTSHCLDL